jgi:DNA mismatch repair ATPase MutS
VPVLVWLVVPGGVALAYRSRVWRVIRRVDAAADDLSLLEALLLRLEQETFTAPRLGVLRGALAGNTRPSRLVAQLRRYIAARDALRNEFVRPFGLLLLVRSQAAVAIDRWHAAHRASLAAWIATIGEFESLSSLATYAFEHPEDPFPALAEEGPLFQASGISHPLLPEATAVRNDLSLGGTGPCVLIVSGSNMSGKSTLLRAVGANAVLALAGAPVRARQLTLSSVAIGATIRVEDSLQQGHSRFYSEILKIRDIVQLTTQPPPVLFLLDEILHGTNSHDRKIGAEAIVRALVDAGAIGLVTTHDLALTALASSMEAHAENVHFEDRIEDGRMVFDYRMRSGVVERSNALELMRAVGLRV